MSLGRFLVSAIQGLPVVGLGNMRTPYQVLGIPKEATAERVKHAYRSLVKTCHPDLFPSGSEAQGEAEKRIREINSAYAMLSNPGKRASYDAKLNRQISPHPEPKPEHCDKCGKLTLFWHTGTNVPLCYECGRRGAYGGER
jgi:DnaJ-domain-containing protein 1